MAQPDQIDRNSYPFAARYLEVDGHRLHYIDEGQGEPLLLVHGTPSWSYEWRHVVAALAPQWRCIAPDYLGFGLSDRPRDANYTPEAHAARLSRFVAALGLEGITLVLHDFGGPIGLPLCFEQPARVRRLVILNSWMWSLSDDVIIAPKARLGGSGAGRLLYQYANFPLRTLMPYAYGERRKLTPAIHRQYLDRFPDAWSRGAVLWPLAQALLGASAFYDSLWQRRERLHSLPALILWGMADRALAPHLLSRWGQALPAADVVELPGVGHWPQEEAPERVIVDLRRFLMSSARAIAPDRAAEGGA